MNGKDPLPEVGKLDRGTFDRIIFPRLGRSKASVLIGPQHGVDAAVLDIGGDRVMVVAEDPTFGMPSLIPYFGWSIVHICASDVAVLGVKPQYMTICLMLPPGTAADTLDTIWTQIHEESERLGIAIVGGHTGVYPGISFPLNGGCTVWGFGNASQITAPCNAREGDHLILTKGVAIEAAAVLAVQAETQIRKSIPSRLVDRAKARIYDMSVVKDALVAAAKAHAMHDATEGGFLNGAYEMAVASGVGLHIYERDIPVADDIKAICDFFHIDPLLSISEGTLLIAASPENTPQVICDLAAQGIEAWVVGEFVGDQIMLMREDGSAQRIEPVKVDPFWKAYFEALTQH